MRASLLDGEPFRQSTNPYDWLGHGVYFWEANPGRALQWAKRQRLAQPCVVGAVLDLRECLDLFSEAGVEAVRAAHAELVQSLAGATAPPNSGGPDRLKRTLDCAVIEYLCANLTDSKYDTVRGIFREGKPIYPSSGFYLHTHIQLCVRNPACIQAVFRVPEIA